jgi:hypothetical protein
MCGATRDVRFGPIADTVPSPLRSLLLQFEAIIADATGSINREHERECNFGLDRTWHLRLFLFLGPEWRRGDY